MGDSSGARQIKIQCRCGKQLVGPASAIGHTIACPACGRRLRLESRSAPPRRPAQPVARPAQPEPDIEPQAAESSVCENCGASLPAGAILCVQCGFNRELGQVLTRSQFTKTKKGRKAKRSFELALPKAAIWAIAVGVPLLIGAGVGLFLVLRGGSPKGTPAIAQAGPATSGMVASQRVARPEPSKDPKDWQSSFTAFAANFSGQQARDPSGRPRWELRSQQISLVPDAAPIQWDGVLMGRDRRMIVSAANSDRGKHAFGFGFPELASLPDPFAVLFSIDEARAAELLKLSYRRIRIEGKFDPVPRVVWVTEKEYASDVVAGPPIQAGEPTNLDLPQGEAIRPIYVIWVDITRFELAK